MSLDHLVELFGRHIALLHEIGLKQRAVDVLPLVAELEGDIGVEAIESLVVNLDQVEGGSL